jgi:hypothetical protein
MKLTLFIGKTLVIISYLLLLPSLCFAQSISSFQGLNAASFIDQSLFKFTITGVVSPNTQITSQLMKEGELIGYQKGLVLGSENFTLGSSCQLLQENFVSPYRELIATGSLPAGNYTLKHSMIIGEQTVTSYSRFAVTVNISPFLSLLNPVNKEVLESQFPLLIWNFGTPLDLSRCKYKLYLFESTSQNSKENSLNAIPKFQSGYLTDQNLLYPTNASELEYGKTYQWFIKVYFDQQEIAQSTIWNFRLEPPKIEEEYPISKSFIDLENLVNSSDFYCLGKLRLRLNTVSSSEDFKFQIFDSKNKEVKTKMKEISFQKTNPYLVIDLQSDTKMQHKKWYNVKLTRSSGEQLSMRVFYINPEFYAQ